MNRSEGIPSKVSMDEDLLKKEVYETWEILADWYAELEYSGGEPSQIYVVRPEMHRLINCSPRGCLLDACCGPGLLSYELASKGWRVTGIDISPRMILHARSYAKKMGITNIKYLVGDITRVNSSLADKSFDMVICNLSLMDLPNCHQAIQEIYGLLKDSGSFIFSIAHPCFDDPGAAWDDPDNFHIKGYFNIDVVRKRLKNWKTGELSPHPWPHFRRPISQYIQMLVENHFHIEAITEPRPTPEGLKKFPEYLNLFDIFPAFMVFSCIKRMR